MDPNQPPMQPPQNPIPQATAPVQPRKNNKLLILIISTVGGLLILLSTITVMYAYGVIPAGNSAFQEAVSNFVQGLPFMPKTLPFVLKTSLKAHEKVTKFTLDASVAGSSKGAISLLGGNNFDLQIQGPIDYTDPEKPILSLNAKITRDFDIDLLTKGYLSYFRITKLPVTFSVFINAFLGLQESDFVNKWFYYDSTPLETDARKTLDEQNKNEKGSITNKIIKNVFASLEDPQVIKSLTMKNESFGTLPLYHIHFAPNDKLLDTFWDKYVKSQYPKSDTITTSKEKVSDTITNFVLDIWVDRNNYFVRKSISTFTIKGTPTTSTYANTSPTLSLFPTQTSDIDISMVLNLSDYGKDVPFVAPTGAVEFTQYMKSLSSKVASRSAGISVKPIGSATR